MSKRLAGWVLGIAGVVALKLWLGARLGLLADEAYYWVWSRDLSLHYFDHPPLVAFFIAIGRSLGGDHALAVRLMSILSWGIAAPMLLPWARRADLWLCFSFGAPLLAALTSLAVPDAPLLSFWALGLSAALRGGRWWWLAGLASALAVLSKQTGLALLPLALLAADRKELARPHPWGGLSLSLCGAALHLLADAGAGFPTLRFQLAHGLGGLAGSGSISPLGPLRFVAEQAAIWCPFVALAAVLWSFALVSDLARGKPVDRVDRMCFSTSIPLLIGFSLTALGAHPEANWPAPAFIGLGLGLSRARGPIERLFSLGAVLWAAATVLLVAHIERPIVHLPRDPAARFTEGRYLADEVGRFVIPAAYGEEARLPVYTERYQEAALLSFYGIEARTLPGCGRRSQYDLLEDQDIQATEAWFVRPKRSGPLYCTSPRFPETGWPSIVGTVDARGRRVGPWDLFRVRSVP